MPEYKLFTIGKNLDAVHCFHHENHPIRVQAANENCARNAVHSVVRNYSGGGDTSPWLDKSKTVCREVLSDEIEFRTKILYPEWMEKMRLEFGWTG